MAIRAAGLVCVAVAALAWLQPCSSLPVDARELSLRRWEKDSRERGDDLCLICQVLKTALALSSVSVKDVVAASHILCVSVRQKYQA